MRETHTSTRLSPDTDRAVERLTEEHTVTHDGHVTDWPPLLEWLQRAVTDQTKKAGGGGSSGSNSPLDLGALFMLERIEQRLTEMRRRLYLPARTRDTRGDLIEAWNTAHEYRAKDELDEAQWEHITDQFQDWVRDIESEWDERTHRMELTVPCPRCGERWIYGDDPNDPGQELKRRSAVVIEYGEDRAPIAECRATECAAMWAGWNALHALGFTLGAQQDLAILEACGISLDLTRATH